MGLQERKERTITLAMLQDAAAVAGLEFGSEQYEAMLDGVNRNLQGYSALHQIKVENSIAPPLYFNPLLPGMKVDRTKKPFRTSPPTQLDRPQDLEQVAFWPILHLAQLIKTKQAKSVELTDMYLARLRKYNSKLNCVVTFADDLAMKQARQADTEIAAGKYKGPLHGIPWGCKDIISVAGYPTTWGSPVYRDQIFQSDATVVRQLNKAGAVLIAKLATGELALDDRWFGGQTKNPWNLAQGSSGSSAGPAAATSAGLVAFSIGTETRGSIISPSSRCGATGCKPSFGRVSRNGVMAVSWTLDKVGPICRTVEDCAIVLKAIAGADTDDLAAVDIPFNWDAQMNVSGVRVGILNVNISADDQSAYEAAIQVLKSLRCTIVPITFPTYPAAEIIATIRADDAAAFDELTRTKRDALLINQLPTDRPNAFRIAHLIPAVEYLQAHRVRALVMRDVARIMETVNVLVVPESDPSAPIHNLTGQPSVSVPSGFKADETPKSIVFVGRVYGEAEMLAVAKAYQEATGWHLKHPPQFA